MVRIELRHQVSAVFATPLRCTPEMRRDNAAYIAPSLLDIGGGACISRSFGMVSIMDIFDRPPYASAIAKIQECRTRRQRALRPFRP